MAPWRGMVWRTTRLGVLAFASDGAWCCTKAPGDGGRAAVSSSFGTFAVINKKGRLLSFDEPFRVVLMKTIQGGEFDAREMESVLVEWWPGSGARRQARPLAGAAGATEQGLHLPSKKPCMQLSRSIVSPPAHRSHDPPPAPSRS